MSSLVKVSLLGSVFTPFDSKNHFFDCPKIEHSAPKTGRWW